MAIRGDSSSLERAVDSAERSLTGLVDNALQSASALEILESRADEAGDEMADVSRESEQASRRLSGVAAGAAAASGSFAALNAIASPLTVSLSGMASTPLVVVLPALAAGATALLSTLIPLAAVVGTLAAGFGALAGAIGLVVGSGLLAFGEERGEQNQQRLEEVNERIEQLEELEEKQGELTEAQQEELETLEERQDTLEEQTGIMGGLQSAVVDLRDELAPLITEWGRVFVPLIEDAIDAIPELVERVLTAAGGFGFITESLRELGGIAMDVIPAMVRTMVLFARIAMPPFMDFIDFLRANGQDALFAMLRITRRLAPTFRDLGRAFMNALPELAALGTATLEVLLPAFADFLRLVEDVINLAQAEGGFVGFVQAAVSDLVAWVQGPGMQMLRSVGETLLTALTAALDPDGEGDDGFFGALQDRISSVLARLATWMETGGQEQIQSFLTSLFGSIAGSIQGEADTFVDQILTPIVTVLSGLFRAVAGALADPEGGGRLGTAIGVFSAAVGDRIVSGLETYFSSDQFLSDVTLIADALLTTIGNAIVGAVRENPEILVGGGATQIGEAVGERLGQEAQQQFDPRQTTARAREQGALVGAGEQRIRVVVEEDGDVFTTRVEEEAQNVIETERREVERNTGGRTRP